MPQNKYTNADLERKTGHQPFTGLNSGGADVVGPWSKPPMSPQEEAYNRGDDLTGGQSLDAIMKASQGALDSSGALLDQVDLESRPSRLGIQPTSKWQQAYDAVDRHIDPQLKQMVTTLAPAAMFAGGPLGAGAGMLLGANEAYEAGRPQASFPERVMHAGFAAASVPGGLHALKIAAGAPTAAEAAQAASSASTREAVAAARGYKAQGFSPSMSGKLGGVPSGGKSAARTLNMTELGGDVGQSQYNIPRPAAPPAPEIPRGNVVARQQAAAEMGGAPRTAPSGRAASTVPVKPGTQGLPESVYGSDLNKLGGQQGVNFEERAAMDRRSPGGIGDSAYQTLLKMLGGRGADEAAAGGANAAARAEQAAGVPGGRKALGEARSPYARRGKGVTSETYGRPRRTKK